MAPLERNRRPGVFMAAVAAALLSAAGCAGAQSVYAGETTAYSLPLDVARTPPAPQKETDLIYSDFLADVNAGKVARVVVSGQSMRGTLKGGTRFRTLVPEAASRATIDDLVRNGVRIRASAVSDGTLGNDALLYVLPLLLFGGLVLFMRTKGAKDAPGPARSFCSSRARQLAADEVKTSFADVAGIDEAKQEVAEIVEFLKDPGKFERLGGHIPKGVLVYGSPGTGKTLLARAIAGEAGVPFFSISGSDFVEMYVGVGASRVRDLFEQAKSHAPCIVFIDEIDAVGRHRGTSAGGGHDEREQTLNQLLVEMDGFDFNKGIIVIAATNRPDVLDAALLRPGRFDRRVVVPLPDLHGREQILRVHMRRIPLAADVELAVLARGTPGFSGAELANLVNEASLFAARAGRPCVSMAELEQGREKILMGPERRSLHQSEEERKLTAYHEAGHAIVGLEVPDHDPVYKVSIVPRGYALGVTAYLPEADRATFTRESLESRISALLGGRVAEELIFGPEQVTTGASNDIQAATEIARRMVIQYGMSERLGPLDYSSGTALDEAQDGEGGLKGMSEQTARTIDREVRALVERNHARAREILETRRDALHRLATALLHEETLEARQIRSIMAGPGKTPLAAAA